MVYAFLRKLSPNGDQRTLLWDKKTGRESGASLPGLVNRVVLWV